MNTSIIISELQETFPAARITIISGERSTMNQALSDVGNNADIYMLTDGCIVASASSALWVPFGMPSV
jgi:hypothetical protein